MSSLAAPALEAHSGLTDAEVAERLARDGYNELPAARPRNLAAIARDVVREPMFLLLIACGTIYLVLGDLEEAIALLAAVFLVIGITVYQENKTERALQALRQLSSPRALVIRNGDVRRIVGREVVVDDLIVLQEGDRVPADARVLSSTNVSIDESLLTGESVPVRKKAADGDLAQEHPGGDERPFVYSGTLIVHGDGLARVLATGARTELGRIGHALAQIEIGRTRLQQEVARVVGVLATLGLGACVIVAVGYGALRGRWLDGVLAGLTLAISMIPEEFPMVLTIFLALGAWRISRSQVLTRRIPAVETLGSATVLCVDKTGTLTLNRMSVAAIVAGTTRWTVANQTAALPDACARVIDSAILSSKPEPFDPMERAFFDFAHRVHRRLPSDGLTLEREYPLTDRLLAVGQVWRGADGSLVAAAKGGPEAIADICRVGGDERIAILAEVERMAQDGLRVLGVAACTPPAARADAIADLPFGFVGLVGLADPVRPGVVASIEECRAAQIRVVMITGDYPATALNIGRQIGLADGDGCLTGPQLRDMGDDELRRRAAEVDVFARMVPDQKLRLVSALRANDEVVAMTGDGVNDAPALKAADIGIAMGGRGTDVAREAAALVLLDDDFTSIVRAVRLGRRIYDNIVKATAYVLAIHVPIAGIAIIPVLGGWPLVLMPVHVIFMELIIDPACSIAFEMEPEEPDVMRRPPRNPSKPLFTSRLVLASLLQGAGALAATLAVLVGARAMGLDEPHMRGLTFATLIVTNLALIFTNRSHERSLLAGLRRPNPALRWLGGGALAVLAVVLYVPAAAELFRVARPGLPGLLAIAVAFLAAVGWMEGVKKGVRIFI